MAVTVRKVQGALNAQLRLRRATSVARTVRLYGKPAVACFGTLLIHDRVRLYSTLATIELAVNRGGTLEIGEETFVNYGTSLSASQLVRIGPRCNIGTHCIVMDNDFHCLEPERRLERPESRPIVLEENVWLGARAIVLPGVTIGEGSVIGAGSVVTRDVPPRAVAAGVPARVIRQL